MNKNAEGGLGRLRITTGGSMMKKMKKLLSVIFSIVMIASVSLVNNVDTKAAVKIKFGKKLTITAGSTDIIVVKGKAKAKSSKNKIAKVTKVKATKKQTTITVKGYKSGKVKITVKVKKSKKKVPVTVKPAKVNEIQGKLEGNTTAALTWTKAKGATGYEIYRSTNASTGFAKVGTSKTTSFKNTNLALGTGYYFKVRATGSKSTKGAYSPVAYVKTWKLVWNDEFSGTSLDTSKWNNKGATGAGGYGNNELQNYQMDYCEVKDGSLVIKPTFQWDKSKKKCVANSYYSTKLWTRGSSHLFTYGKIEFTAKMPKGKGTWAAGWMLGPGGWPDCGEIDVFETTSDPLKQSIPQTIHCKKYNGMKTSSGPKHYDAKVPTATTAFHTYTAEWTPTHISFYIDGKLNGTYDPSKYTFDPNPTSLDDIWPYKRPFYLIMNCAIGGTLGGDVGPDYWKLVKTNGNIETYEDYLYFDSVRVYQ